MSDDVHEFITGESDPSDFKVDEVVAHLEQSDADEVARVKALEGAESYEDAKHRVTVLDWEPPAPPTAPTPETVMAQPPEGPSEDAPVVPQPVLSGPQIGDVDHEPEGLPEGYSTVLVSTDGSPTEATALAEEAKADQPVVVG